MAQEYMLSYQSPDHVSGNHVFPTIADCVARIEASKAGWLSWSILALTPRDEYVLRVGEVLAMGRNPQYFPAAT